jgi:hypothetical protein
MKEITMLSTLLEAGSAVANAVDWPELLLSLIKIFL